jgi:hypothetical protein
MKQHPSPEELHKQAVPVIRDLVRIQAEHYGMISVDSLIYAMVRHLALTIPADSDRGVRRGRVTIRAKRKPRRSRDGARL